MRDRRCNGVPTALVALLSFCSFLPAAEPDLSDTIDYIRDSVQNNTAIQALQFKSFKYQTITFDLSWPGVNGTATLRVRLDKVDDAVAEYAADPGGWHVVLKGENPIEVSWLDPESRMVSRSFPGFPAMFTTQDLAQRLARAFKRASTLCKSNKDPFGKEEGTNPHTSVRPVRTPSLTASGSPRSRADGGVAPSPNATNPETDSSRASPAKSDLAHDAIDLVDEIAKGPGLAPAPSAIGSP
jgi:hypothetical protein